MNRQCFQLDEFFLDPANRLLRRGEIPISLSPKAFDALVYLVRNPGRLLTRDELMKALWPDSFVEEGNLSVHIFQVRKALDTAGNGKTYIQTVPRKGYRFQAAVKLLEQTPYDLPPAALESSEPALPVANFEAPAAERESLSGQSSNAPIPGSEELLIAGGESVLPPTTTEATSQRKGWSKWLILAGAACLLVVIVLMQRALATRDKPQQSLSSLRLTSFSPELSVSAAALSPDGKTLAYANSVGLFLEDVSTKDAHALPLPASGLQISNLSWFPDGNQVLVTGVEPQALASSVWMVSTRGGSESARIGAYQRGVVSPDGSQIALEKENNGTKELWLLPASGGPAREIAALREDLGTLFWSPGGRQLLYVGLTWDAQFRSNRGVIRALDLSNGNSSEIFSAANLSGDAIGLPDGRLLYGQLLGANPAGSYGAELREVHVPSWTGKAVGGTASFGRWPEPVAGLSVSADGRRLAFRTVLTQHNVYEGDLAKTESTLLRVRRLTLGKGRDDFPRAWTPDSQSIFFDSNRSGKWEIFKQGWNQISDEPYLQGANDEFNPRTSPDGRFLLYLDRSRGWREPQPVRLLRVPIAGGWPQFVLKESGYSEWGLRFECPQRAGAPCVLAQRTGNQVVFRPFDPETGFAAKNSELFRIPLAPDQRLSWSLSPDDSRLAWIRSDAADPVIHVVSLLPGSGQNSGSESREKQVLLKSVSHLHALNWSPQGEAWYVTTHLPGSWAILYVTQEGHIQALWQGTGEYAPEAWPSPDRRHLAFSQQEQDSNVWMLEGF